MIKSVMSSSREAVERLRLALDLFEAGEALMRQNLRRKYAGEDESRIEARLVAWLHERPGAEQGDAVGPSVPWPRRPA